MPTPRSPRTMHMLCRVLTSSRPINDFGLYLEGSSPNALDQCFVFVRGGPWPTRVLGSLHAQKGALTLVCLARLWL
jgi:hypothetical protein